jgi:hypothetical protein
VRYCKSQRYSAIEHLARVIWLGRYSEENLMGMLYAAYFDASGKEGFPFVTVAGAVSSIKKWTRFEREWKEILENYGVTEFHATDFAASLAEYKGWKGDKVRRSKFLGQLIAVLKKNTNRLFTVTVDIEAWEAVNTHHRLQEYFYSPYALAGFGVVGQCVHWAKRKKAAYPEFVFEEGDEGWEGLVKVCERECGVTPIRLPKKKAIPCQVGDLLAWRTRTSTTNAVKALQPDTEVQAELKALDGVMVRPGHKSIYSRRALELNCGLFKIPKR